MMHSLLIKGLPCWLSRLVLCCGSYRHTRDEVDRLERICHHSAHHHSLVGTRALLRCINAQGTPVPATNDRRAGQTYSQAGGKLGVRFNRPTPPADSRPTSQATLRPVDLNQATVADLEALPGIGRNQPSG